MLDDGAEIIARSSNDRGPNSSCCIGYEPVTVADIVAWTSSAILRANGNCPGEYVHVKSTAVHPAPDGNDGQDKTRDQKIADYAQSKGWTRRLTAVGTSILAGLAGHPTKKLARRWIMSTAVGAMYSL